MSDAGTNGVESQVARRKRPPEGGVPRKQQRSLGVSSMHEPCDPVIEHDHLVAVLAVLACTRWCSQLEHCLQSSTGSVPARPFDAFLQR